MTKYIALAKSRAIFFERPTEWEFTEEEAKDLETQLETKLDYVVEIFEAEAEDDGDWYEVIVVHDGFTAEELKREYR